MIDELFLFPIVSLDGDKEDARRRQMEKENDIIGNDEVDYEPEMYFAEAEYPHWDFVGIQDHWLPTKKSQYRALKKQEFDACIVRFLNVGQLLVPWTKKKFKAEIQKFAEEYALKHPKPGSEDDKELMVVNLTDEQLAKLMEDAKK